MANQVCDAFGCFPVFGVGARHGGPVLGGVYDCGKDTVYVKAIAFELGAHAFRQFHNR